MTSAGVPVPSHFIRLSAEVRDHLSIWSVILEQFNGRLVMLEGPMSNANLEHRLVGFGRFWGLFPGIVVYRDMDDWIQKVHCALFVWEERLRKKRVLFFSYNLGVVTAVNSQTANSRLWLYC